MLHIDVYTKNLQEDEKARIETIIDYIKFKSYAYKKMARKYGRKNTALFTAATIITVSSASLSFLNIFSVIATPIGGFLMALSKFKKYESKENRCVIAAQTYDTFLNSITGLNLEKETDREIFYSDFRCIDSLVISHCPNVKRKITKSWLEKNQKNFH